MLAKIEIALHPVRAELVEAPFYSLTGRKKKSGPSTSSGRAVQSSRSKLPVCRTAPSGADRSPQPFEPAAAAGAALGGLDPAFGMRHHAADIAGRIEDAGDVAPRTVAVGGIAAGHAASPSASGRASRRDSACQAPSL